MSAPDHDAESARADNALRSLAHARASLVEAVRAFGDIGEGEPEWGVAKGSQVRIGAILDRLDAMVERETARRDAAELAARAAHPAERGACDTETPCPECATAYGLLDAAEGAAALETT